MESQKYELNLEDGKKIGKGLLIALGGAALTFVSEIIPMVNWGEYTPVAVAVASVIVNACWKFMRGY